MLKVYRVYSMFHESDESGSDEYGIFSDLDKAKDRMRKVAQENITSHTVETEESDFCFSIHNCWGDCLSVRIKEYELDINYDDRIIGYT